jgi:hypothetical protein
MTNSSSHLASGASQLIPKLGFRQERLIGLLAKLDVVLASAALSQAPPPALPLSGQRLTAFLFDPETPNLQLPVHERGKRFTDLPYGRLPQIRSSAARLDEAKLLHYVQLVLAAQLEAGASVLVSPYHFVRAADTGRQMDLQLARLATSIFEDQGMAEPRWSGESEAPPRQLLAGLMLDVRELRVGAHVEFLLRSYAGLEVDGYLVRLVGLHEAAENADVGNGARLLRMLELRSGRPVVADSPGNLALPLLAGGLSAVSLGIVWGERVRAPTPMSSQIDENGRRRRYGKRHIYHPRFLRSFESNGKNAVSAFRLEHCDCGEHEEHRPPTGGEIDRHTSVARVVQAAELTEGTVEERAQNLRSLLSAATWAAAEADVPTPKKLALETVLNVMLEPLSAEDDDSRLQTGE